MRIGIIVGSHRKDSQSQKVGKFISSNLKELEIEPMVLDLGEKPLPMWDESFWKAGSELKSLWAEYSKGLADCEALVLVTPEYAGMASPAVKNFMLFVGGNDFAHKPAMIVTVSSGMGGNYPNAELRMSSYKNTRLVYIPDHVVIRHVEKVLNGLEIVSQEDEFIRKRIHYSLSVLKEYGKAFVSIRSSSVIDLKTFPFGM